MLPGAGAGRGTLAAQSVPLERVTASIERVFGSGSRAVRVPVGTDTALRVTHAGSVIGFARVGNVRGRDLPITFLVAVDPAGNLLDVDILVYREPYGGEVAYDSWREQFRGATAESRLQVGRDIRGISGATISVHAVTRGIRQTLQELAEWRRSGQLK
ncbi:MAG: FMN-binding protein [Gemmatimonadales bacterium]